MRLPDGSKTAGRAYAKCIMDFQNRIRGDFRNNGQKWAVDVGIEAAFPEAGIDEGYMVFTNEDILSCFEPVVNRILELVRNQIIAIQAQNRTLQVSGIALISWFSLMDWGSFMVGHSTSWSPANLAKTNISSSKSSFTCLPSFLLEWFAPWIHGRP